MHRRPDSACSKQRSHLSLSPREAYESKITMHIGHRTCVGEVCGLGSGFRGLASALHPARVLLLLLAAGAGGWEAGRSHLGPWKRFSGRPPMEARLCGTYTRFVGRLFRSLRADCAGSGFGGFCWVRAASVQFSPAPNHCKPLQTTANHPARHASRQQQACSNPYQPRP